jgi:hypothetical protein
MVKQLKSYYVLNKRLRKGLKTGFVAGDVKLPDAPDKAWQHAVRFFLRYDLNMACCVRARFALAAKNDIVPPNTIGLFKYLPIYREACAGLERQIVAELEAQKQICRDYMLTTGTDLGYKGEELLAATLLNDVLELTPLFRYALAHAEGLPKIAKRYSAAAMAQYQEAPKQYRELWKEWLPDTLPLMKKAAQKGGWRYARTDDSA